MKESKTKSEESRAAAGEAGKALKKGFAEVKTPTQAAHVLDKLERAASDMEEKDLARDQDPADPAKQATFLIRNGWTF